MTFRFVFALLTAMLLASTAAAEEDRETALRLAKARYAARLAALHDVHPERALPGLAPLKGDYVERSSGPLSELFRHRSEVYARSHRGGASDGGDHALAAYLKGHLAKEMKLVEAFVAATRAGDLGRRPPGDPPDVFYVFEIAARQLEVLVRAHRPGDALRLCAGLWAVTRDEQTLRALAPEDHTFSVPGAVDAQCTAALKTAAPDERDRFVEELAFLRATWPSARLVAEGIALATEAKAFDYLLAETPEDQLAWSDSHGRFDKRAIYCIDSCLGTWCKEPDRQAEIAANKACEHTAWRAYGAAADEVVEVSGEKGFLPDALREKLEAQWPKDLRCTSHRLNVEALVSNVGYALGVRREALHTLEVYEYEARYLASRKR